MYKTAPSEGKKMIPCLWCDLEVHYFTSVMTTPLSAFPLGLKLVDSCSIGCLFFYLHFLVLILHREKNMLISQSFAIETACCDLLLTCRSLRV